MLVLSTMTMGALLAVAPSDGAVYRVDPAESRLQVHVGRAGIFGFAGHEHEILSTAVEGRVIAHAADLAASRVELRFATAGLHVSGKGEPPEDVPQVQARMEGAEVLDLARFPEAAFTSRRVTGKATAPGRYTLTVEGDFTFRGVTRKLEVPVAVSIDGDVLTATGTAVLRHDELGLKPISVAGVVKVKNEIGVELRIVARLDAPRPAP